MHGDKYKQNENTINESVILIYGHFYGCIVVKTFEDNEGEIKGTA